MTAAVDARSSPGEAFRDPSFRPDSPLPHPGSAGFPVDPRLQEAMRDGFSKDLEANVQELVTAVAAQKDVDPEFLHILQQDIDALHQVYDQRRISHDSHVWSELYRMNIRLQELALTMNRVATAQHVLPTHSQQAAGSSSQEDVVIPLVGKIEDPLTLCSDSPSPINKGLQILHDEGYRVRRVRGNGHCLFSSIAAHLMTPERLAVVSSRLPMLKDTGLLNGLEVQPLIDTCQEKLREGVCVEALMQNQTIYDGWVKFLRTIATNWWRKEMQRDGSVAVQLAQAARESTPELQSNPDDRKVCETYLRRMETMPETRYGGEPEIFAIQRLFGIDIHTVDVKELGKAASKEAVEAILPRIANLSDMWLLYSGSHFDPLYLSDQ